jgi:hypothetical protein
MQNTGKNRSKILESCSRGENIYFWKGRGGKICFGTENRPGQNKYIFVVTEE